MSSDTPIKRYLNWCAVSHGHDMMEHDNGPFMLYSDYKRELSAAHQEIESLKRQVAEKNKEITRLKGFQEPY